MENQINEIDENEDYFSDDEENNIIDNNIIDNNNNNNNNNNNIVNLINLLNIKDTPIEDYEQCAICKDDIDCMQKCKLPECGHEFHVNCIISWFRNGDSRCPYCGNKGLNHCEKHNSQRRGYNYWSRTPYYSQKLQDLRTYAYSKKNQDNKIAKKLRSQFERVKKSREKLNQHVSEFAEFKKKIKTEDSNYSETRAKMVNYRRKRWTLTRQVRCAEENILETSYVVPLIIPMPVLM